MRGDYPSNSTHTLKLNKLFHHIGWSHHVRTIMYLLSLISQTALHGSFYATVESMISEFQKEAFMLKEPDNMAGN